MTPFCPPRSIVVSCQPGAGSPLRGAQAMALLAQAAVAGGAAAIRANGVPDISAIRKAVVDIPILGINKLGDPRGVFITPTVGAAAEIVAAGRRRDRARRHAAPAPRRPHAGRADRRRSSSC